VIVSRNKIPFKVGPGTKTYKIVHSHATDMMPWRLSHLQYLINRREGYIYTDLIMSVVNAWHLNKKSWLYDNRPE
jgi:hypothetical protein